MSIRVEPGRFASVSRTFGSGTLIAHHPHIGIRVLTVDPEFDGDGTARMRGVGGTILEAMRESGSVTIVWQPAVRHGWALIYDGRLDPDSPRLRADGTDDDELALTMMSGMLHRPTSHSDGPEWQWPETER